MSSAVKAYRCLAALLCTVALASVWRAKAAPVNIVNFTSGSTLTTSAATAGCTTGQVVMVIAAGNSNAPTGVTDSAGGNDYQVSPAAFQVANGTYVQAIMAKRVVGAGTQITTSTTFTIAASGAADLVVSVYCISDGAGIPTTNDASDNSGESLTAPAATASSSYQFAAVIAYGALPSISAVGWTNGMAASGPGNLANLAVAYRQSGGTSMFGWSGPIGGFDGAAFSEVSTGAASFPKPQSMTLLGVQ